MGVLQYAVANESIIQTIVKDKALTPIHLATRVLPPVVLGVGALLFAIGVALAIALAIVSKRSKDSSTDGNTVAQWSSGSPQQATEL